MKQKQSLQYFSDLKQVRLDVPQGSILGPFFLLYINDLPAETEDISKPTLFADNISIMETTFDSRQLQEYFNTVTGKIMQWLQANSLILDTFACMILK
jgi:hypothetical protein